MRLLSPLHILKIFLIGISFAWVGCAPSNQFEMLSQKSSILSERRQSEKMGREAPSSNPSISEEVETVSEEPKFTTIFEETPDESPEVQVQIEKPDFEVDRSYQGSPQAGDLSRKGMLKPTVYYYAKINEDKSSCFKNTNLRDSKGTVLLRVCQSTASTCALQGSCAVIQSGKEHNLNIHKRVNGEDRYFEIEDDECRFGYGVKSSCLDPFYTVAADLNLYQAGQVIYVPSVVGLKLPDGSEHNGYFVVRDSGRAIKGTGRFDFFSGSMSWRDKSNPFVRIGLHSKSTSVPYFRVGGETAKKVLRSRAYPELPTYVAEEP